MTFRTEFRSNPELYWQRSVQTGSAAPVCWSNDPACFAVSSSAFSSKIWRGLALGVISVGLAIPSTATAQNAAAATPAASGTAPAKPSKSSKRKSAREVEKQRTKDELTAGDAYLSGAKLLDHKV